MKSQSLLFSLLLFLFLSCTPQQPPSKDTQTLSSRPNIIWLVAEDLSPIIPSFGDSTVQTPNLSRLAAEGVRYTQVFSPSGVCAPSRAALCTGMYPTHLGAHNMRTQYHHDFMAQLGLVVYETVPNPEVKMMSEVLRAHGYYCTNNDKTDYQFVPTKTAWDENSPYAHWRHRAAGQPFFSIFNFDITHESQVFGPYGKKNLRFVEPFPSDPKTHPVPSWNVKVDSADWDLNVSPTLEVPVPPYLPDTEVAKNDIRRVYSNVVEMDKQVGVLLKQLEADGLLENTIVVWYTDHGGPLPRQKRLLYDSGIRVPMIIRYPEKWRAGEVDDQLISFVDFAPTIFSLAGIKPPAYLDGQAFLGIHEAATPRTYIHAAADRLDTEIDRIRAVRDKRYKYLRNFYPDKGYYLPIPYRERMHIMQELLRLRDTGALNEAQAQWFREKKPAEELFDIQNDPHELNNLAADPAYVEQLAALRKECDRWMQQIEDKGAIPEKELISHFWPDWQQPQTVAPVAEYNEEDQQVVLTCSTPGASIGYQTWNVGSTAPKAWQVYTKPFPLTVGDSLQIIGDRIGYKPSEIKRWSMASFSGG